MSKKPRSQSANGGGDDEDHQKKMPCRDGSRFPRTAGATGGGDEFFALATDNIAMWSGRVVYFGQRRNGSAHAAAVAKATEDKSSAVQRRIRIAVAPYERHAEAFDKLHADAKASADSAQQALDRIFTPAGMTTWHLATLPARHWHQATRYMTNHGGPHKHKCPHTLMLEHLATSGAMLGQRLETQQCSLVSVVAEHGAGKTELLEGLFELSTCVDIDRAAPTENTRNRKGWHCLSPSDFLDKLNAKVPPGVIVQHVAVFVATFDNSKAFQVSTADTEDAIERRTIERWLMMMDPSRPADCRSDHSPLTSISRFTKEVRRQFSKCEPGRVAVMLCLDEVLVLKPAVMKTLLAALAVAVKEDLEQGLPTFGVVTSLHWNPLAEALVAGVNLHPVPLHPLWDITAMMTVVMKAINANTALDISTKTRAMHAASVSVDIAGGSPRQWKIIHDAFASLRRLDDIRIVLGATANEEQAWALFHLFAVHMATRKPYTTTVTDDIFKSMIDRSLLHVSVSERTVTYWPIPSAWVYSECGWSLDGACRQLREALYSTHTEVRTKAWEKGMLAVMYLRARGYAAYAGFSKSEPRMSFTRYIGDVDPGIIIGLNNIFGEPGEDGVEQGTLFFSWDGERLDSYTVDPQVLRTPFTVNVPHVESTPPITAAGVAADASPTLIIAPEVKTLTASDLAAGEMFVVGGETNQPAIEALSTNFCIKGGKKITLLFQHKLHDKTDPLAVHECLDDMRKFAEGTLQLKAGEYLNVLFTTGTAVTCAALSQTPTTAKGNVLFPPVKGAVVVGSGGLSRMLEPFGATTLGNAVFHSRNRKESPDVKLQASS